MSTANRRVAGAFLVGFALIAGAFLVAKKPATVNPGDGLAVAATPSAPRERIEIKDTDNNGIPDWQEALQRTEPILLEPVSENYEPPETLTDQFAIDFFKSFVQAGNNPGFGSSPEELAELAMNDLNTIAQDELYGAKDIKVTANADTQFKRQYTNTVFAVLAETKVGQGDKDPIEIVLMAVQNNKPNLLNELDVHIAANTTIRDSLLRMTVPIEYAKQHLNLTNSLTAVIEDLKGFKNASDDPLYTMVRLKRHQEDQAAVLQSLVELEQKIFSEPIPFEPGDYVYPFLNVME